MERKYRLDKYLVKIGLFPSREKAKEAIKIGKVSVNGRIVKKGGVYISGNSKIELSNPKMYVSRAAEKLKEALTYFNVEVENRVALDIGAGTGGFTEILLENGIKKVYAVDVGTDIIHRKIRENPKVIVLEGKNARYLSSDDIQEGVDIITEDTSFISSKLIIPNVKKFLKKEGDYTLLVKPQFEGEREALKRGVKDISAHKSILIDILKFVKKEGFQPIGLIPSPVRGKEGNVEYLLYMKKTTINNVEIAFSNMAENAVKMAKERFYEDRNLF